MLEPIVLVTNRIRAHIIRPEDSASMEACFQLRYDYFVVKRGWVKANKSGENCETDRYDQHAHHISVSDGAKTLAYVRALPYRPEVEFMLDREFSSILSGATYGGLEREGAVELSRLVVARHLQRQHLTWKTHPVEHLLKALYHLALEHHYHHFYIVVEEGWPRIFGRRFGLPFTVLGEPYTFPDGTRTVAAVATLAELEAGMRRHSTAKYEWYQRRPEEIEASPEG